MLCLKLLVLQLWLGCAGEAQPDGAFPLGFGLVERSGDEVAQLLKQELLQGGAPTEGSAAVLGGCLYAVGKGLRLLRSCVRCLGARGRTHLVLVLHAVREGHVADLGVQHRVHHLSTQENMSLNCCWQRQRHGRPTAARARRVALATVVATVLSGVFASWAAAGPRTSSSTLLWYL
jgi:hypothetical protein